MEGAAAAWAADDRGERNGESDGEEDPWWTAMAEAAASGEEPVGTSDLADDDGETAWLAGMAAAGTEASDSYAAEDRPVWAALQAPTLDTSAWADGMMVAGSDASLALPEHSDCWGQVAREATNSGGVAIESAHALAQLRAWLLQYLPHTCRLLGLLSGPYASRWQFLVDNASAPRAVIGCSAREGDDRMSFACFATHAGVFAGVLAARLKRLGPEVQHVCMEALDESLRATAVSTLRAFGFPTLERDEPSRQWTQLRQAAAATHAQLLALPSSEYSFVAPAEKDVARMNATWKYGSPARTAYLTDMVRQMPCAAVAVTKTEAQDVHGSAASAVAWCLTYPDLSLGVMYVEEAHRRRGLGRAVAAHLCLSLPLYCEDVPRYCFIEPEKPASEAIFARLGFDPTAAQAWTTFGRSGGPE